MTSSGTWIVAVFLDETLVVESCGPYRSEEKAHMVADRINAAAPGDDMGVIAQAVQLTDLRGILRRMEAKA